MMNLLLFQSAFGGGVFSFLPLVLIFAVFYFLVILPQRKRQQKIDQMLKDLKSGDKVVALGGLLGTVVGVKDDTIQLQIAPSVRIDVMRGSISGMQQNADEAK